MKCYHSVLVEQIYAAQVALAEADRLGRRGSSGCRRRAEAGLGGAPQEEFAGGESNGDMPMLSENLSDDDDDDESELQPAPAAV